METCPVCGNETLVREGGCLTCMACGYSKCEDKGKLNEEKEDEFILDALNFMNDVEE